MLINPSFKRKEEKLKQLGFLEQVTKFNFMLLKKLKLQFGYSGSLPFCLKQNNVKIATNKHIDERKQRSSI